MEVICSFPSIGIPVKTNVSSSAARVPLLRRSRTIHLETALTSLKKFAPVNKVFEDKETGVTCYSDDNGELICEGYDEGPRFTCQPTRTIKSKGRRSSMESWRQVISQVTNRSLYSKTDATN